MAMISYKLSDLLLDYNLLTRDQLEIASAKQKESGKKLWEILLELEFIDEKKLIQVLEFKLGVPHVDLSNYILDSSLARFIPENIARRYQVVALERESNILQVAMVDPSNIVAIDDIQITSGLEVEPRIATSRDIKRALSLIYASGDDSKDIFASLEQPQEDEGPQLDKLKEMIEETPIVRLTNYIINQAIQTRSSDIHVEPQENYVKVRYRIDGVLQEDMRIPKHSQAALISRLKIIANLDITRRMIPQDGRIAMNIKGIKIDMRVSTVPTIYGEKIVIRILDRSENLVNLNKLGFSLKNYNKFISLIEEPYGIILVTGPTGSGKSTSLIAALNYLNSSDKNIITIEDPVEYRLEGINQIQANNKTGLNFATVLRSILRQDPDIIMIGEIRDEETAQIAIRASLTGHLVLSTLHTNDAVSSITRLIDMGLAPYLVSSTVIGIIAQRLVRRLCNHCKEEYLPNYTVREQLKISKDKKIYRAKGCKKCNATGYLGRVAIHELLTIDNQLKELIIQGSNENEIKEYASNEYMDTLRQDGLEKIKEGITSVEELVRVSI